MKITGTITDIAFDYRTGKPRVTLLVNEKGTFLDGVDELKDCEKLTLELKKYRLKRSLNANNYAWSLLNEIANVLRADKDEVYLRLLKRYGQSDMISVRSDGRYCLLR